MADFWQWWTAFSGANGWKAFFLAAWSVAILSMCVGNVLRIVSLVLRAVMVLLRGWPPVHLDADGDWKPAPKDGE